MLKRKLPCRVKTEGPEVKEESKEIASESESASNDEKLVELQEFFKSAKKLVTYVANVLVCMPKSMCYELASDEMCGNNV